EMVAAMRPGSVLIDLAVERGGNVEGAIAGQVADVNGVKIVGHLNVPGRIAATASQLYARNLYAFLETLVDKEAKLLKLDPEEELVKATLLTHQGKIVHPAFAKAEAEAAPAVVTEKVAKPKGAPKAKASAVKAEAAKEAASATAKAVAKTTRKA